MMRAIFVDDERWASTVFKNESENIPDIELLETFSNPFSAIEFVKSNTVSLAFLDVEMPGMNGIELAQELRKISKNIIIIFITAHEVMQKNYSDEFVVIKPYNQRDIENVLNLALINSIKSQKQVFAKTFGEFELYVDNKKIELENDKEKEAIAFLVDKNGLTAAYSEISLALYGNKQPKNIKDLKVLFENINEKFRNLEIACFLKESADGICADKDFFRSDLCHIFEGNAYVISNYSGNYLNEYNWAKSNRDLFGELKNLLSRLKYSDNNYIPIAYIKCCDDDFKLLEINDGFCTITGYTKQELFTNIKCLKDMINEEDYFNVLERLKSNIGNQEYIEISYRLKCKNGQEIWVADISRITNDNNYLCLISDISSIKINLLTMQDQINYDVITGMYVREMFEKTTDETLTSGVENAVMMTFDIDGIKKISATQGAIYADSVITEVASAIKGSFCGMDAVIGRCENDIFSVFLPGSFKDDELTTLMRKCLRTITNKFSRQSRSVSCCLGVSLFPQHGNDFKSLYYCSKAAVRHAKRLGKGSSFIYGNFIAGAKNVSNPIVTNASDLMCIGNCRFTEYAFNALYLTSDIIPTIEMLLRIMGEQLDVSRVYIYEKAADGDAYVNTFEWCAQDTIPAKEEFQFVPSEKIDDLFLNDAVSNKYVCINNIKKSDLKIREEFEPKGIKALFRYIFNDESGNYGMIGFDECREPKFWSGYQLSIFIEFSRVVNIFLRSYRLKNGFTVEKLQNKRRSIN